MTTMTKAPAKKAAKPVAKRTPKKQDYPPMPDSAEVVTLAGQDYMVVSLEDYDEWLTDAMFDVMIRERLKHDQGPAVPFEEVEARLFPKNKGR